MNKKIALFVVILLIVPCFVYAVATFVIQETDRLSLNISAADPDNDEVQIVYSPPLNEKGEWQTDYGDAGEYGATVTVSDGSSLVVQEVKIIVNKKEEKPAIESFTPQEDSFAIFEMDAIRFTVVANDLNNDELYYEWFVDGKFKSSEMDFTYATDLNDDGSHTVSVSVSDNSGKTEMSWNVEVNDIDVEEILANIPDVEIFENDVVMLELPDLFKYGLKFTISEPVGDDNEWQTTYDDAGTYKIRVTAEGIGFREEETVNLEVKDVDRVPIFKGLDAITVAEQEEIQIELVASDPDGDEIEFSADGLPEEGVLDDNKFTWSPNYDFVKAEGFWDRLVRKFMGLSKNQYIEFSASSNEKIVLQNAIITVKDANRAPVIEDIGPITVNEGEEVSLDPVIYDLDEESVKISYSGISKTAEFKTGYDDEGAHELKITASDGKLTTEKTVEINILNTNRAPYLKKTDPVNLVEGDQVSVILEGVDPDGDALYYDADNLPEGAELKGNAFIWTPSFDTTDSGIKQVDVVFVVSDDELDSRQIVTFYIENKNRAPRIIDTKGTVTGKVNKPILMAVQAEDPDGNDLKYTWEFNFLEKYDATPSHMRIFTSKGLKQVKVIVSDGTDEIVQLINVNVV